MILILFATNRSISKSKTKSWQNYLPQKNEEKRKTKKSIIEVVDLNIFFLMKISKNMKDLNTINRPHIMRIETREYTFFCSGNQRHLILLFFSHLTFNPLVALSSKQIRVVHNLTTSYLIHHHFDPPPTPNLT